MTVIYRPPVRSASGDGSALVFDSVTDDGLLQFANSGFLHDNNTGHARNYVQNPYRSYIEIDNTEIFSLIASSIPGCR